MFLIHVLEEVYLAFKDTASLITTVILSKHADPEDLPYAGRLIVRVKGLSGIKIFASRAADLYRISKASFSVCSFLRAFVYPLLTNVA